MSAVGLGCGVHVFIQGDPVIRKGTTVYLRLPSIYT